jgi:hypothetical protein
LSRQHIGVVSAGSCDFLDILARSGRKVRVLRPAAVRTGSLRDAEALLILGGTEPVPLLLDPRARVVVEEYIATGKRVFAEYCESITDTLYCAPPESTRFQRLVCRGKGIPGLEPGDILDDQCNSRVAPYYSGSGQPPLLAYAASLVDHRKTELRDEGPGDVARRALWLERPNLLVATFRLSSFHRARFAPLGRWRAVVAHVLGWLCGEPVEVDVLPERYRLGPPERDRDADLAVSLRPCVDRAVGWFTRARMLVDSGRGGAREGLGTEIAPDGRQRVAGSIRNDCTGEVGLAFFMHHLLTGSRRSLRLADNLLGLCFGTYLVRDGPHRGMMRWTNSAWGVCYQDDAARVLIPGLLRSFYGGDGRYVDACVDALRFLVRTTGTDGTRVSRTDVVTLTPERAAELASAPGGLPSGHYNAWYHAALLLAYKVTGIEEFRSVAVRGLETIMAAYPETRREISETEELCRLVLPLAWLFWVTGEKRHRGYLDRVVSDLDVFAHPSGAYLEWDTGYRAALSRNLEGESSLLARNGDPVVEMLYSLNWLPAGFAQAYLVTGDPAFLERWRRIARFFLNAQISSSDPMIDGAWTRALDVELMEVYGVPNDVGWGPWAIESGWTVGEVAAGLATGLLAGSLAPRYGGR